MELSRQQIDELNEFYWDTDVSTKELKDYFGISKPVHRYSLLWLQARNTPTALPTWFTRPGAPEGDAKRSAEHAVTREGARGGAMAAHVTTAAPPEQKRSVGAAKRHFSER
jgi:5-methylcytosine-specific restriction endonuclease McrA